MSLWRYVTQINGKSGSINMGVKYKAALRMSIKHNINHYLHTMPTPITKSNIYKTFPQMESCEQQ